MNLTVIDETDFDTQFLRFDAWKPSYEHSLKILSDDAYTEL